MSRRSSPDITFIASIFSFSKVSVPWAEKMPTHGNFCSAVFFKTCFTRSLKHFQVKLFLEMLSFQIQNFWKFIKKFSTFLSKLQRMWSKLHSTCPKERSEEGFWGDKLQKRQLGLKSSKLWSKFLSRCSNYISILKEDQLAGEKHFLEKVFW